MISEQNPPPALSVSGVPSPGAARREIRREAAEVSGDGIHLSTGPLVEVRDEGGLPMAWVKIWTDDPARTESVLRMLRPAPSPSTVDEARREEERAEERLWSGRNQDAPYSVLKVDLQRYRTAIETRVKAEAEAALAIVTAALDRLIPIANRAESAEATLTAERTVLRCWCGLREDAPQHHGTTFVVDGADGLGAQPDLAHPFEWGKATYSALVLAQRQHTAERSRAERLDETLTLVQRHRTDTEIALRETRDRAEQAEASAEAERTRREGLTAERDRATNALREYGSHFNGCVMQGGDCSCGFIDAWFSVFDRAPAAAPGDAPRALADSVERTRPLVDAERASERVSGDLMEFRMGAADD